MYRGIKLLNSLFMRSIWLLEKLLSSPNDNLMIFTDPDLTITVDLDREEQEKNGRRKLKIFFVGFLK